MENSSLIIHPRSRKQLDVYLNRPTHALILSGTTGVGIDTIAMELAQKLARNEIYLVTPDEKSKISVETVRNLYKITRGRRSAPFAVVISDIDKMTPGAGNAFLKALEEPVDNVFYIMSTHRPSTILPTVLSRSQVLEIAIPGVSDAETLLIDAKITPAKRQQIQFMTAGRPAEIMRLLSDEEYFRSRARTAESAKKFISGTVYERLKIISVIKKREEAIEFMQILANLLLFLSKNGKVNDFPAKIALVSTVMDNLTQNGNIRAQLTYLATNMVK